MEIIEQLRILPQNHLLQPVFHLQPARIDMATVEPVDVPIFPAPPYAAVVTTRDEAESMEADNSVNNAPPTINHHSMMDGNLSVHAEELDFPRGSDVDEINFKAICPPN
ncbi:unnamed protein product [Adineta ricciae]|uniref:Uncharacterized protein n=1 Tax=Adineta ricciae TaxID=249248 RepID=A0A813ZYW4_ADIRI|nr:unnamed protein product [Adineta ricciae]CAF1408671.1 unnamed protein product [Adineta ricciae]